MKRVAAIHAEYTEFRPETLKGYDVSVNLGPSRRFQSIEEAKQWAEANSDEVIYLSSIDNLITDMKRRVLN